jgi:hypothetical protein
MTGHDQPKRPVTMLRNPQKGVNVVLKPVKKA